MNNPFKFGTVVEKPYFTDRKNELLQIQSLLESRNHLILISPRRFGKTSLVMNAVKTLTTPVISLDLQIISNTEDFASVLLKRIYKNFPIQKIKSLIKNFRIIPSLTMNPLNSDVEVSFQIKGSPLPVLEDVFQLLENLSSKQRTILILDEFQEILRIERRLDKNLRSIMQHHKNINYIFLGSQESMMKGIFEKKKSPFYHFGYVMNLGKIPKSDFEIYLKKGFGNLSIQSGDAITCEILEITDCHPYYTQQLAFCVWENLKGVKYSTDIVERSTRQLITSHDYDYERIWSNFNNTDKRLLIYFSQSNAPPLSKEKIEKLSMPSSTIFSSIKRLLSIGYLIKTEDGYEIDDPFFKLWIIKRRNQ